MVKVKPCRLCYLSLPADGPPYCADCLACQWCGKPIAYTGTRKRYCDKACQRGHRKGA